MTDEQLMQRAADWLKANAKMPEQVRHGYFPLGMVARWIERAEKAEARVAELEGLLKNHAPLLRQCAMRISGRIRENRARLNNLDHLDPKATPEDLETFQALVCAANKAASDIDAALEEKEARMIEELKAAIADVQASGEKWDGLAPWSYPGGKAAAFLAKHGPVLIAAVELAEATKAMEDGLEGPDGFGDMNLVRDYKRAMDAYSAAKKEASDD